MSLRCFVGKTSQISFEPSAVEGARPFLCAVVSLCASLSCLLQLSSIG